MSNQEESKTTPRVKEEFELEIERKVKEDREKAHNEFCEYMEAVECGEIQYL